MSFSELSCNKIHNQNLRHIDIIIFQLNNVPNYNLLIQSKSTITVLFSVILPQELIAIKFQHL